MLDVQVFLRSINNTHEGSLFALSELQAQFGIKHSIWEDRLVVLNYSQIDSPKLHPITLECRSLVLELGTWVVVSRSFDRFFNVGEVGGEVSDTVELPNKDPVSFSELVLHEKMDGSLIGIFEYAGRILYRTRSVIMPVGVINGFTTTWKDAIEQALPCAWGNWSLGEYTAICELTCRENRVVVKYDAPPTLTLLACRKNNGDYTSTQEAAGMLGFSTPRTYSFGSTEDCIKAVKELPNLEEGYVAYAVNGSPCIKIKNPAYVAAHHLRGEGLNEKRILDLVLMGEVSEYLSIFEEDTEMFEPYVGAYNLLVVELDRLEDEVALPEVVGLTQKDFALRYKDKAESGLIFQMRRGVSWKQFFPALSQDRQRQLVLVHKEEE